MTGCTKQRLTFGDTNIESALKPKPKPIGRFFKNLLVAKIVIEFPQMLTSPEVPTTPEMSPQITRKCLFQLPLGST